MMSTTTLVQKQSLLESPLLVIERILRDPEGVWAQISTEFRLNALIGQMLTSSAIALACYGAVLGFPNSPLQALSSAVKLPVLFLLTLAICLPTLSFEIFRSLEGNFYINIVHTLFRLLAGG